MARYPLEEDKWHPILNKVEEEKLAARQARNLEAYKAAENRYRYQAMDMKV